MMNLMTVYYKPDDATYLVNAETVDAAVDKVIKANTEIYGTCNSSVKKEIAKKKNYSASPLNDFEVLSRMIDWKSSCILFEDVIAFEWN